MFFSFLNKQKSIVQFIAFNGKRFPDYLHKFPFKIGYQLVLIDKFNETEQHDNPLIPV